MWSSFSAGGMMLLASSSSSTLKLLCSVDNIDPNESVDHVFCHGDYHFVEQSKEEKTRLNRNLLDHP